MAITSADLNKNASKSFTYKELCHSSKAIINGVNNLPNDKEYKNLGELATKLLQPIRDELDLPIIVNSGFRNAKVNRLVGGVSNSAHLSGYAVDIRCPGYENGNVKAFCEKIESILKAKGIKFDQLIFEYGVKSSVTSGWVHVAIKGPNGSQRGEVISINRRGTFKGITY